MKTIIKTLWLAGLLAASGCIVNPVPTPGGASLTSAQSNEDNAGFTTADSGAADGGFKGVDAGSSSGASSGGTSSGGQRWPGASDDAGSSSGGSDTGASSSGAGDAGAVPGADTISGGNTGLSQAGAQDFGLFRQLLEQGKVPSPGALDELGFFHEHKLDYPDPKCGQDMCMHGLLGQMGNLINGSTCTVVQIGLNTHLQPSKMKRPPLHIVLAVDVSSSMAGAPLSFLKQGLQQMLDHLEAGDKVSLVAFAEKAAVLLDAAPLKDKLSIEKAIITLSTSGNTNLYEGLFKAFKLAAKHHDQAWDNRVVLLTDGEATTGMTKPGKLVSLATGYAKMGIGITTIGVGQSAAGSVLAEIAEVGAGSFYFLDQPKAVKEVFTEEVQTFLVPVALDVTIKLDATDGYVVGGAYGTRGWKGHTDGGTIHIPTLFLAGRKKAETPLPGKGAGRRGGGGGILVELMPLPGVKKGPTVANLALQWTHPKTGKVLKQQAAVSFGKYVVPDGGAFFSDATVEKGFVMLNILAGFQMAMELAADSDPGAARGVLQALKPEVEKWLKKAENPDPDIEDDLKYVALFIDNLKKVANQTPVTKPPDPWPVD